jgi:polysaccharide deacetylase family sporulation protein PdaB
VPIYSVDTVEKKVAITFDSAWGADKTQNIVDILNEYNVIATFFLVGFWVEKYPEMVKILNDNNIEIGTHSNTHADFAKLSKDQMKLELTTSMDLISNITGKSPTLFRAPYGSYNNNVISIAESVGLKTIQWDVDTLDWKGLSAMDICNRTLNKVNNGSIILCHNNSEHILEALPLMLQRLKLKGYTVTSVGNLIYHDNYTIDSLGVQHQN